MLGDERSISGRAVAAAARCRALRLTAQTIAVGAGIALFGCGSQEESAQSAQEPPAVVEELGIEDLAIGAGPECRHPSQIVTIHYRGILLDGRVFDSSYQRGEPIVASLDSLIPGWQQGMPGMRVGGRRRLTVPASLAYSGMAALQVAKPFEPEERAEVLIQPESTLVFEIELLAITPGGDSEAPSELARSAER
ncbi:MAG: FKBP-type peptidyl-prolyl cis-trans isomerase [Deltaproteobacteria bacterium]|jgi:FKBP-type peptidyl-prolyl cis-trans isomerase|nr:FKBP-type peptidyl-prolyl cis-trans isomerase [Deltaproteobacteria bacterium]